MGTTSASTHLQDLVKREHSPHCIVITCLDRVRRERALTFLTNKLCPPGSTITSCSFADKQKVTPSDFMRELEQPSLFDPKRYGILHSVHLAKASDLERVIPFMEKPSPQTCLFIVGEGLPNIPSFKKVLEKHAEHVQFTALKGAELARWVEKEFRQNGVSDLTSKLVDKVLASQGEDVDGIAKIIEKYALFLDGTMPSPETLELFLPQKSSASEFDVAEALLSRQRNIPELLLHQVLAQGTSPFMLIGLLSKTFVTLFAIRFLLDRGVGQNDIRSTLDISPWLFGKYLPLAKRISLKRLGNIIGALQRADFGLKDRSLGVDSVMSSFTYRASLAE
jgi:DNA polymerase-3 subunit delta